MENNLFSIKGKNKTKEKIQSLIYKGYEESSEEMQPEVKLNLEYLLKWKYLVPLEFNMYLKVSCV